METAEQAKCVHEFAYDLNIDGGYRLHCELCGYTPSGRETARMCNGFTLLMQEIARCVNVLLDEEEAQHDR